MDATQAAKPQPTFLKDSVLMRHKDGVAGFSRLLMRNKTDLMWLLSRLPSKTVTRRLTLASVNSNIKHTNNYRLWLRSMMWRHFNTNIITEIKTLVRTGKWLPGRTKHNVTKKKCTTLRWFDKASSDEKDAAELQATSLYIARLEHPKISTLVSVKISFQHIHHPNLNKRRCAEL